MNTDADDAAAPRPRVAIVVQRYGRDITGGAEMHARLLARALAPYYRIDVLTSCARDYRDWTPELPAGDEWDDGVRVRRLPHPARRRDRSRHMPLRHKLRYLLASARPHAAGPLVPPPGDDDRSDGLAYLRAQGPAMDSLLEHLRAHGDEYQALVFLTARFFPTAFGVLVHPERSLLVPTLHDEKAMYLPHFHRVFRAPAAVLYNTRAEQAVATRLYGPDLAPGRVCGVGINLPPAQATAAADPGWPTLAARLGLGMDTPFLLYLGRVDPSKGCDELFAFFARSRRGDGRPLKLVVCGKLQMAAPSHPDIVLAGFVDEADRDRLLARAQALVLPSRHESLSLVVLESLAAGCPVIVHRACAVLRDHVADSGVGWTYDGWRGWQRALAALRAQPAAERAAQAVAGRRYVEQQYAWPRVIAQLRAAIDALPPPRATATA